jgi:hypothetical protein
MDGNNATNATVIQGQPIVYVTSNPNMELNHVYVHNGFAVNNNANYNANYKQY